ncbi:hypothetical protein COOONC_28615 [Cooperia oncophora]
MNANVALDSWTPHQIPLSIQVESVTGRNPLSTTDKLADSLSARVRSSVVPMRNAASTPRERWSANVNVDRFSKAMANVKVRSRMGPVRKFCAFA